MHVPDPSGASRTFLFLGGDSYPADRFIENEMCARLATRADRFIGQDALLREYGEGQWIKGITGRAAMLRRALAACDTAPERIIVIGRSSGARVATLLATEPGGLHRVGALICLAYPFRPHGAPREPVRFRHLAELRVPTLILQGRQDPYGGEGIIAEYPLSAAVRTGFVDSDHAMRLTPDGWAEATRLINALLGRVRREADV
jgi:predicted alpha/beta-hydrolase family hydrolase